VRNVVNDQFRGQIFSASGHLERKRDEVSERKTMRRCVVLQSGWHWFFVAGQSWRSVASQKVTQVAMWSVFDDHIQRSWQAPTPCTITQYTFQQWLVVSNLNIQKLWSVQTTTSV